MRDMKIEFQFYGKARWRQLVKMLLTGKIRTFLTEQDILRISKQYLDYKAKISAEKGEGQSPEGI